MTDAPTPLNPLNPSDISETSVPLTKPEQIWLVDYECRTDAVRISLNNKGFYAFGQEPCWAFSSVAKWHKCLFDPETDSESYSES
jgi:hypothetical protein